MIIPSSLILTFEKSIKSARINSFFYFLPNESVVTHTIQETIIIEQLLLNTGAIESFVERFAAEFHSWGQSRERNEQLRDYMTDDLYRLN